MKPRSDVPHPKVSEERTYHVIVSPSGGANDAFGISAGRSAYRDDHQRNHGPDLDEPVDGIVSEHEFLTAALQAARY
jgi:hypothetical protein